MSWVILHDGLHLFFSGNTGYFAGFNEIGARYGTFDLGLHPWQEPFDRICALARERGVPLATPEMGEPLDLKQPQAGRAWWRDLA